MNMIFTGGAAVDEVSAVTSKSAAIRALICASLADKESFVKINAVSEDIAAALGCIKALGAGVEAADGGFWVKPAAVHNTSPVLDCGASASVLRMIMPVVCALGVEEACFIMRGSLAERPIQPLIRALESGGITARRLGDRFYVSGKARGGDYFIDASISSQYTSGLLFMLSICGGMLKVRGKNISRPYLDMTLDMLKRFKAQVTESGDTFTVPPAKLVSPGTVCCEGDWSGAVPFIISGITGDKSIKITGLNPDSLQADRAAVELLCAAGAKIRVDDDGVSAFPSFLAPFSFDAGTAPDLVPCLAAAACAAAGESKIYNAARLRGKESDRICSTAALVNSLGGRAETDDDGITVYGTGRLRGGCVNSFGDHRIVMAAACAAGICDGNVTVKDAGCIDKSYPGFCGFFNQEK